MPMYRGGVSNYRGR